MKSELNIDFRKTGIGVVGDVPWGTHFCHFYETKQDLLDTLVPYFQAGLKSKEFCIWLVADPLTTAEARRALEKAVPDLDEHFLNENIEIIDGPKWYLTENVFNLERAISAWDEKLNQALARGYEGLRVSGDVFWLREKDRRDFLAYEKQLNDSITDRPMTLLCTYPLAKSNASEILNVVATHQFVTARRHGEWQLIETPELLQAKAEIKRFNEELENQVDERTKQLAATNEELRNEIAERKRAETLLHAKEDALKESQRLLEEAQRIAHVGHYEHDLETGAIFASDENYRIFGLQPQDTITLSSAFDFIHPDDRARVHQERNEAVLKGQHFEVEFRMVRPDGEVRYIHSRGDVIRDEQGRPRRTFGVTQDITERKRAEEALRRSEDRLRLVVDTIPLIAWSLRPDGTVDFLNQRWVDYSGLSLEQFVAEPTRPIHPEDVSRVMEKWRTNTDAGEPYVGEMRLRRAEGGYRWFLVRTAPLRDEEGNVVKWYGVSIDIEDRKQAEEALDERLRFETLVTELSAAFANLSPNEVDSEIDKWLQNLAEFLGVDRATFFQFGEDRTTLYRSHSYTVPGIEPLPSPPIGLKDQFPWIMDQLRQGVTVKWSRIPDDMPEQAAKEKEYAAKVGVKSGLNIPVLVGGSVVCAITFTSIATYRDWSDPLIARLRLVGEIFAAAVERKRAEDSLRKALLEINQLKDQLYKENIALREEIVSASMFEEIIGTSPALQEVLVLVAKVAPTDSTVLITGETGTGKELIARAIHKRSNRAAHVFMSVNCAAIPPTLIASELFGHEKGAFTGAVQQRLGRFELAEGGTLFLDEIGELPTETQIVLLRVLQEHEFERVGGTKAIRADVRVIAATNRDLHADIDAGTFRRDLFYRLNVFPIEMPSLRDRREDIPLLVEYFIQRYASKMGKKIRRIDKKTLDRLASSDWPGNIRELQNVIERSVILNDTETFTIDMSWLSHTPQTSHEKILSDNLATHEKEMIEAALAESRGRVFGPAGAAARLGIPPSTLDSKIRALKINKHRFKTT